ncbi:MAG: flippase [Nitrospirae bacterium]|nr:flippase [Candidatus Manganitrophaceae bacterium]
MKTRSQHLKKLAVNSFFSSLSELSMGLLFLLFIIAARILGDTQFGVFSFALAYVSIFGIISDCGLRYLYITMVSRDPSLKSKYFENILSLQIFLSLICFAFIYISINLFEKTDEAKTVVYFLAGAEVIRSLKFFFRFVFRTSERFKLESLTVSLERLALLIVGATLLSLGFGVVSLAATFLFVRIVDFFITLLFVKTILPLRLGFDLSFWPTLLKQGMPFALTGLVMLILLRIDTVMISLIKNDTEVGWYNAGYKLIEAAAFFPAILVNSLLPSISSLHGKTAEISMLYQRAMRYILLIAIPLSIIAFILAEPIIIFVFGSEYHQTVIVFKILLLSLSFTFIYHVGSTVLSGIGQQKMALYIACAVLLLNIILNAALIPNKGYVGAAIATMVSEFVFCLLYGGFLFSLGYKISWFKLALKPLIATSTISFLILLFPAHLGVTIFFAILGYFGMMTLLSYWDEEEILFIKKISSSLKEYF